MSCPSASERCPHSRSGASPGRSTRDGRRRGRSEVSRQRPGSRGSPLHRRPRTSRRGRGGRGPGHRAFPSHLPPVPGELRRPDREGDPPAGVRRAGGPVRGGRPAGPLRQGRAAPADQRGEGREDVTDPGRALAGRREIELLEFPSVRRMADLLSARCREPSWVRALVSGLDRFRTMTGTDDLERLVEAAQTDVAVADGTLLRIAAALEGQQETAVAAMTMGPKVWFRLNDVPVAWRPLPAVRSAPPVPTARSRVDRLVLLALIGSGLAMSELLRLRVGDVGSLDPEAGLIPDP